MITIISGTNRKGSNTLKIAKEYQHILQEKGVTAGILSLENVDVLHKNAAFVKMEDEMYSFKHKKNSFRFSLVNYLNDQIYINDQLKKMPLSLSVPKTSWLNVLINTAHAEEELDADSAFLRSSVSFCRRAAWLLMI